MHTIDSVSELLKARRESEEPDEVLALLQANAGKKYTVHLLRKLTGGEDRWHYYRIAGMTYLEDRVYRSSQGNGGGFHLLLSYDTSGPHVVDPAWVEEHNPGYFKGRRERNAQRDAVRDNPVALQGMADALNAYERAKAQLDLARGQLDSLTGYGEPFAPDQYDWKRLCGAREEIKR